MTVQTISMVMPSRAGLGALATLFMACTSTSIARDVATVQRSAAAPVLARVEPDPAGATSGAPTAGLPRAPLDAEQAVRVALLHNPALRARLRELGIGRGELVQAGLVANPVVELESLPERDTGYELRVEYELSSLVLAPARADAAEAALDADRHAAAAWIVRLGFEVRAAVYELQAARQRLAVARQGVAAVKAARKTAEALLAAGNIPPLEAATEAAAHERARVLLTQLELDVTESTERVRRLLGLRETEPPWRVASDLPPVPAALPPLPHAARLAVAASHDLAAIGARQRTAAARSDLAQLQGWLPAITLDVHALSPAPTERAAEPGAESWRFGGGLSLALPLFDRRQGTAAAWQARRSGLEDRGRDLVNELRATVRAVQRRRQLAHERVLQYRQRVLPAQAAVMAQTRLQYNAMQLGIFDLLRARHQQLEVRLAYVDALHDYWHADATLRAMLDGARVGGTDDDTEQAG